MATNTTSCLNDSNFFSSIIECIPVGIISVDHSWQIRYCNKSIKVQLGKNPEDLLTKSFWNCFPISENSKLYFELHNAVALQQPVVFEEYFPFLDLWLEVNAQPSADGILIYLKDVSTYKEQEKLLTEINKRFKHVLAFTSMCVWDWEVGSPQATLHGDKLVKLLGYDEEEHGVVAFWELNVHPDDLERIKKDFQQSIENGDVEYVNHYRLRKKKGDYVFVRDRACIIRDEKGKPIKVIGVTDDITDQQLNVQELELAKSNYQSIFNCAPFPKWVYSRETLRFLDVNDYAIRYFGYSREEFLKMTILDIRPQEDHQKVIDYIRKNESIAREWTYIKKNGERVLAELSVTPLDFQNKNVYLANLFDITEKKKQEEKSKENEEKLQSVEDDMKYVLESMTDGFYILERNWNLKYVTDKIAAMLGLKKEDYKGKNLWTALPELVKTKFYTEYHRAFKEKTFVSFEEYLPMFNMWFEVNAYPYKNVLACYVKDITESKNDKNRLEFIARATSEVIWELELPSMNALINKENFFKVFGYRLPDQYNHHLFWLDKVHQADADIVLERLNKALEQNLDHYVHEYLFQKSDGGWAFVKDRVFIVKDQQGKPVKLIGAMADVTNERLAEKAIKESEQTYKTLFDQASLPKAVYDKETLKILKVNQAAIEHYGYSEEEFLNMTILDFRPPEDYQKLKDQLSVPTSKNRKELGVWTHIKKSGARMQAQVSIATINYKGRVCNLATIDDVTEKMKLNEQLTREKVEKQQAITKATLDAQEKERSEIGRELHDGVNQVLATAKLYVENIKYYPEQIETFVEKSISLIQKSIQEIRVLSKALVVPTIADLEYYEALEEMFQYYRELKQFQIDYFIDPQVERIDKDIKLTIFRIFQEQLNNTVKYAKASKVKIQLLHNDKVLFLLIEDNGVGFDPGARKNGIGLNNIKNRAELFKGEVVLVSAPGKGCRMEVVFPVQ